MAAMAVVVLRTALNDPDYYWHLETGRFIVDSWSLPTVDLFSFTAFKHRWVPHEWLFQVLLYIFFDAAGYLGTKILTALFCGATLAVMYATIARLMNRPILAIGLAFGFFVAMLPGMTPRPHLVTYLCFAIYLTKLLELKYLGRSGYLWILPAAMVIWVNSHGGYIIGLVLLLLFIATERVSLFIQAGSAQEQRRNLGKLVPVAVACVIASLINPEGYHHWIYPFAVVNMAATSILTDWASPTFQTRYGIYVLVIIGCYAVAFMARPKMPDLTEIVVPGVLIAFAFQNQRNIPFAVIASILFCAAALRYEPIQGTNSKSIGQRSSTDSKGLASRQALAWLAIGGILAVTFSVYPKARAIESRVIESGFPAGAVQFVKEVGLRGRMFNEYGHGGYLIHHLRPQKVFIDGRADVYGDKLIYDWSKIRNGYPDWRRLFDSFAIDYVILKPWTPLRQLLLEGNEFVMVYDDHVASVLVRSSAEYGNIIERHRIALPAK
jgi:hypothetical protein